MYVTAYSRVAELRRAMVDIGSSLNIIPLSILRLEECLGIGL